MKIHRRGSGNEGWLTSYADLITNLLIFFILIISASQIQTAKMEKIIAEISDTQVKESLSSAAKKVSAELQKQKLDEDVSVKLTDSGMEVSFNSGVMFPSGSSHIIPKMEDPLSKVLGVIKPYTAKYMLAVEGHTDERPMRSSQFKSNWELSSARAMTIRERIERSGVAPKRIRVEAYADNKPLAEKETAKLDQQTKLAKHRRVVIRMF